MARTKKESALTFHDRLSRLTLDQAENLLGIHGRTLVQNGGRLEVDPGPQITGQSK